MNKKSGGPLKKENKKEERDELKDEQVVTWTGIKKGDEKGVKALKEKKKDEEIAQKKNNKKDLNMIREKI